MFRPIKAALVAMTSVLVVLTCLAGGSATAGSMPSSVATAVPGAITSITTTATKVAQWDVVDLACTWAVPDGAKPGDTFTLQLPDQLAWYGATDFDLKDKAGDVVATAHAAPSGLVTFVLTDFVSTHTGVHGGCRFSTRYSASTHGSTVDLTFTLGSSTIRVPVTTTDPCSTDCTSTPRAGALKKSWWFDASQTSVQSVVEAPPITSDTAQVVITDDPGPGLALDCDTAEVVVGTRLSASGWLTDPTDTASYPSTTDCTPSHLRATVPGLPKGEMVDVWVVADVTDATRSDYTNSGTVEVAGIDTPVVSTTRRTDASGTGDGTALAPTASPTPSPSPAPTPTTSPTPTAGAPTAPATPAPRPHHPHRVAPAATALASTGSAATPALVVLGLSLVAGGVVVIVRRRRVAD